MKEIDCFFPRGVVREAYRRASLNESGLTYDALRVRVIRARKPGASELELEALALCHEVAKERSAKERSLKGKIRKLEQLNQAGS